MVEAEAVDASRRTMTGQVRVGASRYAKSATGQLFFFWENESGDKRDSEFSVIDHRILVNVGRSITGGYDIIFDTTRALGRDKGIIALEADDGRYFNRVLVMSVKNNSASCIAVEGTVFIAFHIPLANIVVIKIGDDEAIPMSRFLERLDTLEISQRYAGIYPLARFDMGLDYLFTPYQVNATFTHTYETFRFSIDDELEDAATGYLLSLTPLLHPLDGLLGLEFSSHSRKGTVMVEAWHPPTAGEDQWFIPYTCQVKHSILTLLLTTGCDLNARSSARLELSLGPHIALSKMSIGNASSSTMVSYGADFRLGLSYRVLEHITLAIALRGRYQPPLELELPFRYTQGIINYKSELDVKMDPGFPISALVMAGYRF